MTTVIANQNINFCISGLVPGVQCPAKRRGQTCRLAHTPDEVNPKPCKREGGESCRCRDRAYPFVCQFIHAGEDKDAYSRRVGFDPKYKKYEGFSYKQYKADYDDCEKLITELGEKIAKFADVDARAISDKDKAYVKRTEISMHHLKLKRKWLYTQMNHMVGNHGIDRRDEYYRPLEEKMKNRDKVRAAFAKHRRIAAHSVFECQDDEDEYNHYLHTQFGDATADYIEYGEDCDYTAADYESFAEHEWVESIILRWNKQESGELMKSPVDTGFESRKAANGKSEDKIEGKIEDKSEGKSEGKSEEKVVQLKDAWEGGSYAIIYNEKQRELAKRVIDISKAEHERLHSVEPIAQGTTDEQPRAERYVDSADSWAERMRKDRWDEKRDKWYYGEE